MKKSFLDQLYAQRHKVISEIELLVERDKSPKSFCNKCKSPSDENRATLVAKRDELISIDALITGYMVKHSD